jgi:pantoate--beta-alanine ligase
VRVIDRIEQVRKELDGARVVGLVPTMGALHAGHLSLIERSAAECDVTLVTVFVNPLQFGPAEDFARYPRDLAADVAAAEAARADLVFAPSVEEMYGIGEPVVRVEVGGELASVFEGAARPGHFSGVATVVAKLFAIAGPCRAYFGEKDWQQLLVVRRLAADLSFPVEVVACPTVREADGLALSSRNRYLSTDERRAATVLYRALTEAAETGDPAVAAGVVATEPLARLDYAGVLEGRLVVAAWVGQTRLIDNLAL